MNTVGNMPKLDVLKSEPFVESTKAKVKRLSGDLEQALHYCNVLWHAKNTTEDKVLLMQIGQSLDKARAELVEAIQELGR